MPILLTTHSNIPLQDFNNELNKAYVLQYFTRVSGTGTMSYNSAATTTEGVGRFEFTGTGRWELITVLPINENRGLGYRANHLQASGAATVALGVNCKNSSMVSLGDRNAFFTGAAPASTTNLQKFIYLAGGTADTFISGTRFATFYINITANTGIYTIDRPYLEYLSFAQKALYV